MYNFKKEPTIFFYILLLIISNIFSSVKILLWI